MKIAVLAEQNFNLIDGSTIWLLNVCKLLALQPDFQVTLLLTHALENRVLADEVPDTIKVLDINALNAATGRMDSQLTPASLTSVLSDWEGVAGKPDRYFVRGTSYIEQLISAPEFQRRLVGYAPSAIPDLSAPEPDWVGMGRALRVPFVVQSDTAARAMESLYDYPAHVVHVVPPIVFASDAPAKPKGGPATLCYSGKVDLHYGLDWLIDIGTEIGADPKLGLSLIAGKDTYRPRYPDFFKAMDAFRADIDGGAMTHVDLVTNVPHAEAKARMAGADFAYCLRHARYDDVIEISTKIVEFCTLGVPPLLNDTALNRALFGDDYPYLVDIIAEDVGARVLKIMRGKKGRNYKAAQTRIAEVAAQFSAEALSDHLGQAIRGHARDLPPLSDTPRRILIATHEPKFLQQFLDRVQGDALIDVTWEHWASTQKPETSPHVPDDVDTVFCEWCCENAVWHSVNKREDTKLIVRLHRFEAYRDFPTRVNWDNVDALIVVSDHFAEMMIRDHGVDPARVHVMPQYIDWHSLDRPKLPEAAFTVGLVGINPFEHKRFDRAVDFFAALHKADPRFKMAVRSVMPWQIDWVWNNRVEARAEFEAIFARIFADDTLSAAIRFDPPGPDMEEWYRGIGTILSSSDSEGCHTSVLEGMASGAYPVVYDWPGAQGLFAPHVYSDLTEAIDYVIAFAEAEDQTAARAPHRAAMQMHDVATFTQKFMSL